ncbi:hypothetical protein BV20DRAFT_297769 [Pilatotrama ljubarskyi]|nr:hypothetical protein BV20DRAFT_297769 [Pilatotrama ljubarskyi]
MHRSVRFRRSYGHGLGSPWRPSHDLSDGNHRDDDIINSRRGDLGGFEDKLSRRIEVHSGPGARVTLRMLVDSRAPRVLRTTSVIPRRRDTPPPRATLRARDLSQPPPLTPARAHASHITAVKRAIRPSGNAEDIDVACLHFWPIYYAFW